MRRQCLRNESSRSTGRISLQRIHKKGGAPNAMPRWTPQLAVLATPDGGMFEREKEKVEKDEVLSKYQKRITEVREAGVLRNTENPW